MSETANRLRTLREGIHVSQSKLASMMEATQSAVNRYEQGQSFPPERVLLWYADFFDVSLDYIFGRTEKPEGKLYNYKPEALEELVSKNDEMREFVDMCFDPKSPINSKLKRALLKMLEESSSGH